MEIIKFNNFAEKIDYDYKKDLDKMKIIWYYTKTREDRQKVCKMENFSPHKNCMWEQTLFLKSIAEKINCKNFFEIGTGRATGSLSISLLPSVEKIVTYDIIDPKTKRKYAVGYRGGFFCLNDLVKKVNFPESSKIDFKVREKIDKLEYKNFFDLCFIDGCHDSYNMIMRDYKFCLDVMKEDAIIIFDDYCHRYPIKKAVDDILRDNPEYKKIKIQVRNTIWDNGKPVDDFMVMITKGDYDFF
tara:strand:- start:1049 stop:1777 length:729 start_codon:yes stop_codon:yes gene_type:complete